MISLYCIDQLSQEVQTHMSNLLGKINGHIQEYFVETFFTTTEMEKNTALRPDLGTNLKKERASSLWLLPRPKRPLLANIPDAQLE